jgi:hypothetical protein
VHLPADIGNAVPDLIPAPIHDAPSLAAVTERPADHAGNPDARTESGAIHAARPAPAHPDRLMAIEAV